MHRGENEGNREIATSYGKNHDPFNEIALSMPSHMCVFDSIEKSIDIIEHCFDFMNKARQSRESTQMKAAKYTPSSSFFSYSTYPRQMNQNCRCFCTVCDTKRLQLY